MPTPVARMKAAGKKVDKAIASPRLSEEEKERRKKAKEEASGSSLSTWVVGAIAFMIVASSLAQIVMTIQTSPSMSDSV